MRRRIALPLARGEATREASPPVNIPVLQCTVKTCTGEVAVDPLMLPAAEILVVPVPVLVATPNGLMIATAVSEDVHITCVLRS